MVGDFSRTKPKIFNLKNIAILALLVLSVAAILLSSQWWQKSSSATQNMRIQIEELERKIEELKKDLQKK